MAKYTLVMFFVVTLVPTAALAQVVVSEIMYNPKGSDSGREWIELYNAGTSDVSIVGGSGKGSWRIGDSSNHTITDPAGGTGRGTLVVPAGGYLVIASDPTEFISGEYAGGSYSVAKSSISLTNTGATVALTDGSGALVDSVAYTKDQGGNDDGASLQRQSTGAWIAGSPTPGAANTTTVFVAADTSGTGTAGTTNDSNSNSSTSNTNAAPAPVSSYVPPPEPTVFADGGSDRTVIVGADTEFDGRAYDRQKQTLDHARFMWNFGDGSTAEGPAVLHHYQYPGRYAVVLTIAQNHDAVSDHILVTAEPAKLSFTVNPDGSVTISNLAGRDLDLSGWMVRSFAQTFTLPDDSIVLAGESLRIPQQTLKFYTSTTAELDYPNGVLALAAGSSTGTAETSAPPDAPQPAVSAMDRAAPSVPSTKRAAHLEPAQQPDPDPVVVEVDGTSSSQVASVAAAFSGSWWWLLAVALAAVAAGAVIFVRQKRGAEWDITEIES